MQGAPRKKSGNRWGPSVARAQLEAMLEIGMEMGAVTILLMKMLVRGRIASRWKGRQYCAPHDRIASVVGGPIHPGKLQVARTVSVDGPVVPHQPRCHL